MMLHVIDWLATWITIAVSSAWMLRIFERIFDYTAPSFISDIFFNLRPFYFPALAIITLMDIREGDMTALDWFLNGTSWLGGYLMLDEEDDDDRWKRRREKLAEKVEQAGGKLVVVPVGSNA